MRADESGFADYLSRHYARLGDQAKHRAGKKRQLEHTYRRLLPEDRAAEMLEIGPGFGQLLELLRVDLGYARAGAIDLSSEVVEFCNGFAPGSTELVTDTAEWLARNPARFERVFLLHVIEHVPVADAPALMRAVRGSLLPGGRVVIEVPNLANVFTGAYLRYADLTHTTGFTETSLHQLLESAGFERIECFEDAVAPGFPKGALAGAFRGVMRAAQKLIYRGYELPVPAVLTPAVCATAVRPAGGG